MERVSFFSFLCCLRKELGILHHILVITLLYRIIDDHADYLSRFHELALKLFVWKTSWGSKETNLTLSVHRRRVAQICDFYNHLKRTGSLVACAVDESHTVETWTGIAGQLRTVAWSYKQLLDEVFVISRIIKVEVKVISRSRRVR